MAKKTNKAKERMYYYEALSELIEIAEKKLEEQNESCEYWSKRLEEARANATDSETGELDESDWCYRDRLETVEKESSRLGAWVTLISQIEKFS